MAKAYELELHMKNFRQEGIVVVPMRSEFRSINAAMKEIKRASKSPESYVKAVLYECDVIKGCWVSSEKPQIFVIDPNFKE